MGGTDNVQLHSMKVSWYLLRVWSNYYFSKYWFPYDSLGLDGTVRSYVLVSSIAGFVYFVGTVALINHFYLGILRTLLRCVMITKMKVFIACIITSICFMGLSQTIFMALLEGWLCLCNFRVDQCWYMLKLILIRKSPLFLMEFSKKRTFLLKCRNVLQKPHFH